jgi:ubiquitin-activating enzyme E1
MGKLAKLRVFIQGVKGLGVETAKNLILAGPKQVVIHDTAKVALKDLGSNFYLTQADVGKRTRGEASIEQLKELNTYVDVSNYDGEINEEYLAKFNVVVFTDFFDRDQLLKWNNFCRTRDVPIGFIFTGSLGLYGFTFVDFGPGFSVNDPDGEDPKHAVVAMITNDNPAVVTTHEAKKHGLVDGDTVKFKEVLGMTEVNNKQFKVKELSPYSFSIDADATQFGRYISNGLVEQVKVPQQIPFRSLEESLQTPLGKDLVTDFENPDLDKWGRPHHLHLGLRSLLAFQATHKRLPKFNDAEDAALVLKEFEAQNTKPESTEAQEGKIFVDEVDKELVQNLAKFADAQTSPHVSFWGGIVAQEIVKHLGKFMPLRQWLHYDTFELLPEGEVNRKPLNSRYDDLVGLFGRDFQTKLQNQKFFLIGAGALGCEFLKLFALSGLGTGKDGKVICTDDDQIEVSNLTRQFLFRKENVKKSKSETACNVAKRMNPDFNVQAVKLRTSPENENFFNDDFWDSLDGVTNAVDNVKARMYIDSKCVSYGKPLFESGTLGTKCNVQIVLPHKTQSYSDSQDPEEEHIPMCTLKNFPYQIEHTIQWARAFFDDHFVDAPNQFQKYSENPKEYLQSIATEFKRQPNMLRSRLEVIAKIAKSLSGANHDTCIALAREYFQDNFHNMIAQLLYNCPPDMIGEGGQKFWSGLKRLPGIITFDPQDPLHADFIFATANLFAFVFKLEPIKDKNYTTKVAGDIKYEKFNPKKMEIKENEKDTKEEKAEDDDARIEELMKLLGEYKSADFKINTIEFEKDDDTNHHIDFISAVANLRARNYTIEEVPRHKVKMIAGKIIPAIATATAMIVGAVGFEIFKYVLGKDVSKFRNAFCNLAIPLWLFSEPLPPIKMKDKEYDEVLMGPVKAIPQGWTKWDKVQVKGPKTLKEILEHFQSTYKVNVSILTVGESDVIYQSYLADKGVKRLGMTPDEAYKADTGKEINTSAKFMEMAISAEAEDGTDVVMPPLRYSRY